MIKLKRGRLRWSDADMLSMARIVGPDSAANRQVAIIDSIIKQAQRRRVMMSDRVRLVLEKSLKQREVLKRIERADDTVLPRYPVNFSYKLWPHQRIALSYLDAYVERKSYLVADQVGVGKTPVAIMWSDRNMVGPDARTLIICRNSAKYQWAREIERWTRKRYDTHIVEGTKINQNMIARRSGWIITHWESLVHARKGLLSRNWDVVIADEAHHMRNRQAQRSETAFLLDAHFKLALTAHPYNKSPEELWSILHFLYPDIYTSFWAFFSMHVNAIPKAFGGYEIEGARKPKLLKWEIAPFTIRRTKHQVHRHLPPVTNIARYVDLPKGHTTEYARLKKQFFVEIKTVEGSRKLVVPSVLARVTRMRQYLVDPSLLEGKKPSIKYPEVLALIEEMDGPPVVFTSFKQAAIRLSAFLRKHKIKCDMIHGDVPTKKRDVVQRNFVSGKLGALIVVTAAGSESLNLGRFGYVIFMDLPWTWLDYDQSVGRVDRPEEGTGKSVRTTAYRIVTRNTYEERIERLVLDERKSMFEEVFTPTQLEEMFG